MINDLQISVDIVKQYKELTSKEEKLFYYAFGKMQHRVNAIHKACDTTKFEEIDDKHDNMVKVSYDEIKMLQDVKRVDSSNFNNISKQLLGKGYFTKKEEDGLKIYFLYKSVSFNNKKRMVEVEFTEHARKLFDFVLDSPFVNIQIEDLKKIKGTKELKLYLYCLSIWRKEKNTGIIKMKIDKLKEILGGKESQEDRKFYFYFISKPIKKLDNIKGLTKKINCSRNDDLVTLSVKGD